MVSPQDEEVFRILDLVREKKADGLERLFTSVDVIAQEEVVGFWRESTIFEQAQKVVILSVDVTAYLAALALSVRSRSSTREAAP